MRRKKAVMMALAFGLFLLSGCAKAQSGNITGIRFERGHGSAWGNQFDIEISSAEIVIAHYIESETMELVAVEHLPVSYTQWDMFKSMVGELELKKARSTAFDRNKLDGGAFRKLTLCYGEKEILYQWPDSAESARLEEKLESFLQEQLQKG